jgi:hypothetical protein
LRLDRSVDMITQMEGKSPAAQASPASGIFGRTNKIEISSSARDEAPLGSRPTSVEYIVSGHNTAGTLAGVSSLREDSR